MLSKKTRYGKTNTTWLYLHEVSKIVKFIKSKIGMVVIRGWVDGEMGIINQQVLSFT